MKIENEIILVSRIFFWNSLKIDFTAIWIHESIPTASELKVRSIKYV